LCQVITTFSTGLTALNGLTTQVQSFATGTSGTDFGISSATSTHTFNLPTASAANRGALSSTDWTTFNGKQDALVSGTNIKTINGASVLGSGDLVVSGTNIYNANGTLTSARTLTSGGFPLTFTGSNTAASAIARGLHLNHTLIAAANSDVLVGLDIAPTFTNGAFSSITQLALRVSGNINTSGQYTNINANNFTTAPIALRTIAADVSGISIYKASFSHTNSIQFLSNNVNNRFSVGQGYIGVSDSIDFNIGRFASSAWSNAFTIFNSTGNISVNSNTDAGFKLDVNGTARVQNLLQVSQTLAVQGATNFPSSGSGVSLYYNNNGGNLIATSNFSTFATTQLCIQTGGGKVAINTAGAAFTNTNNQFRQVGGAEFSLGGATQSFDFYVNGTSGNVSLNLIRPSNTVGYGLSYNLQARNSANTVVDYSAIGTIINTNTAGSHTGSLLMYTTNAGTLAERMRVSPSGSLLINTTTEIESSQLTIDSTTRGFLPPRMTTTQKNAIATPAAGLMVYDTTLNLMSVYNGTIWISL
jgi:hypothetical protein